MKSKAPNLDQSDGAKTNQDMGEDLIALSSDSSNLPIANWKNNLNNTTWKNGKLYDGDNGRAAF